MNGARPQPAAVLVLVLLLVLAACSGDERRIFTPEFPPDIAYAGVLAWKDDGTLAGSSGLVPWSEHPLLSLAVPADGLTTVVAIGYSESDLAELALPDRETLASNTLRPAESCDPKLPVPKISVAMLGAMPEAGAALTAEWLGAICPTIQDRTFADPSCLINRCPGHVEQYGCAINLDLSQCLLGRHKLRIDYQGTLCFESAGDPCQAEVATPPARALLSCQTSGGACDVDFYVAPTEPTFHVDRVQILDVTPQSPSDLALRDVRTFAPETGFIAGMLLLPDEIIVSSNDGRFYDGPECPSLEPNRLHFYTLDLMPLGTATAPPCLREMIADEDGGFFGISSPAFGPREVLHFDHRGRVLARRAFALPGDDRRKFSASKGLRALSGDRLFFTLVWSNDADIHDGGSFILSTDVETLESTILYDGTGRSFYGMDQSRAGVLAAVDDWLDTFYFIDSASGAEITHVEFPHFESVSLGEVVYHEPRLLALVPIEEPAVQLFDAIAMQHEKRVVYYEQELAPLVATTWPGDQDRMVVAGLRHDRLGILEVIVAPFDPIGGRFLPGGQTIGFGVPSRIATSDGALYLTLPWAGELLRLAP